MNIKEAIIAFSQSEKIKSGLIWISQSLEMLQSFPEEKKGRAGKKMIKAITDMIAYEIHIAKRVAKDDSWTPVRFQVCQVAKISPPHVSNHEFQDTVFDLSMGCHTPHMFKTIQTQI